MKLVKWKATMPREAAHEGFAHVVFSLKIHTGGRVEFTGQMNAQDALKLYNSVIEKAKDKK